MLRKYLQACLNEIGISSLVTYWASYVYNLSLYL